MPRPIDRARLGAELLTAGRVLTEDAKSDAHRLGALGILLQRIAWAAGEPEAADMIDAMQRERHERVLAEHDARMALLAPLASDEVSVDWAGCTPDGAEPPLERDRRTSEVPA